MDINNLSGHEFEDFVEKLIHKMGFITEERRKSADGGIDLKAINETPVLKGLYIIQCKRYEKPIGESIIRDLYGVVSSERANKGILITNSSFTRSAKSFALNKPIELIDGVLIQQLIKQYFGDENMGKIKGPNIPQKYKILNDLFEKELTEHEKNHKEIINGKTEIILQNYQDANNFIKYCDDKVGKFAELCNLLMNQFNGIGSLLNILSDKELDYIEINQLKSKTSTFSLLFDDVEKEWLDSLSILPPDNLRVLHKSLVNIYETFYEALDEFSDNLSSVVNDPVDYFSGTDKSQLDEKEPTTKLTFLLTDKYTKVFTDELKEAKLQNNSLYTTYQGILSVLRK